MSSSPNSMMRTHSIAMVTMKKGEAFFARRIGEGEVGGWRRGVASEGVRGGMRGAVMVSAWGGHPVEVKFFMIDTAMEELEKWDMVSGCWALCKIVMEPLSASLRYRSSESTW